MLELSGTCLYKAKRLLTPLIAGERLWAQKFPSLFHMSLNICFVEETSQKGIFLDIAKCLLNLPLFLHLVTWTGVFRFFPLSSSPCRIIVFNMHISMHNYNKVYATQYKTKVRNSEEFLPSIGNLFIALQFCYKN